MAEDSNAAATANEVKAPSENAAEESKAAAPVQETKAKVAAANSKAAESFDGLWAQTKKECRNTDQADSRTLIDLSKPIGGKPAGLQ